MKTRTVLVALAVSLAATSAQAQHSSPRDSAALVVLNQGYIDAFMKGDAAWYDAHTWSDFLCFLSDGSVLGRPAFLDSNRKPMTYKAFGVDSVRVHLVTPDVALISAITPFERPDGTKGVSRYTDTWVRRSGEWKAVRAQITGIRGR
jgi:hypothetical protein